MFLLMECASVKDVSINLLANYVEVVVKKEEKEIKTSKLK